MANGHVTIHDPLANHNNLTSDSDCDRNSTSDQDSMGDTVELRMMMAYATRRRPNRKVETPTQDTPSAPNGVAHSNGPSSPPTPDKTEEEGEKKKKKRKMKGIGSLLKRLPCIKPQTDDTELPQSPELTPGVGNRGLVIKDPKDVEEKDELEKVVERLTEIANEIPFTPPDLESDAPEDEVEKVIGLLLRDAGDRLNEKELKDANIAAELFWNYSFFEKLVKAFLIRMGLISPEPNTLGPQASPKTQIAVTFEVTTRLSAVDTLPMSRMLDHGARYVRDHYSSWAQQEGGYEEAFHSDDEDEDEDEVH